MLLICCFRISDEIFPLKSRGQVSIPDSVPQLIYFLDGRSTTIFANQPQYFVQIILADQFSVYFPFFKPLLRIENLVKDGLHVLFSHLCELSMYRISRERYILLLSHLLVELDVLFSLFPIEVVSVEGVTNRLTHLSIVWSGVKFAFLRHFDTFFKCHLHLLIRIPHILFSIHLQLSFSVFLCFMEDVGCVMCIVLSNYRCTTLYRVIIGGAFFVVELRSNAVYGDSFT